MIESIRLINFKSHKDTEIAIKPLTVLSGKNGVGKSSVIQALLLLRQTHEKNRLERVIDLNSPLAFIGKVSDALYRFPNQEFEDELAIILGVSNQNYSWIFDAAGSSDATYLTRKNAVEESKGYEQLSLFNTNFQYISALRSTDYLADDYAVEFQKQISVTEGKGELVAQFLNVYGRKLKVLKELKHKSESDDFLLSQVSAWEKEISNNVNVHPVKIGDGYDIRYSFETQNKLGLVDELSKKNVGFGLSYVLPILVAILSAEKGALVLVENPEAHIHPNGISKLGELICLAAQSGIQIIVETHSDHIINGILVQSKAFEKEGTSGIAKDNLKIYYFDRDDSEHKTKITEIKITEGGRTLNRVNGFFDQIGKDLRELI